MNRDERIELESRLNNDDPTLNGTECKDCKYNNLMINTDIEVDKCSECENDGGIYNNFAPTEELINNIIKETRNYIKNSRR